MAKNRNAAVGRDILYGRGLAEWLRWFSDRARADTENILGRNLVLAEYAASAETASDIVALFANIIQEAR